MHRPWAAKRYASGYLCDSCLSSPPYHGSHAMLDIAPSEVWGFPRPVAAPKQWISRSNVLSLYDFCFNVSECPSLSHHTLYLQFLCCLQAGTGTREDTLLVSLFLSYLSTKIHETKRGRLFQLQLPFWIGSFLHRLYRLAFEILRGAIQKFSKSFSLKKPRSLNYELPKEVKKMCFET